MWASARCIQRGWGSQTTGRNELRCPRLRCEEGAPSLKAGVGNLLTLLKIPDPTRLQEAVLVVETRCLASILIATASMASTTYAITGATLAFALCL